jgi:hypothetical protein
MPWYVEMFAFVFAGALGGLGVVAGLALYEWLLKVTGLM